MYLFTRSVSMYFNPIWEFCFSNREHEHIYGILLLLIYLVLTSFILIKTFKMFACFSLFCATLIGFIKFKFSQIQKVSTLFFRFSSNYLVTKFFFRFTLFNYQSEVNYQLSNLTYFYCSFNNVSHMLSVLVKITLGLGSKLRMFILSSLSKNDFCHLDLVA